MNCRAQMVSVYKCSEFTLEGWILSFSTQEKEKRMSTHTASIQCGSGYIASAIGQVKEIKVNPTGKKIIKAVLIHV